MIVDSSSIEVNRRARRAKSDGLDAAKLLSMLFRHEGGEKVWSVVRIPTEEEEHARQLHRELQSLGQESTMHVNRIKGLLASIGPALEVDKHFPRTLKEARQWNGKPVPEELRDRLLRDFERLQVINRQIRALNQQRNKTLRTKDSPALRKVQQLLGLRGIGVNSAWLYVLPRPTPAEICDTSKESASGEPADALDGRGDRLVVAALPLPASRNELPWSVRVATAKKASGRPWFVANLCQIGKNGERFATRQTSRNRGPIRSQI